MGQLDLFIRISRTMINDLRQLAIFAKTAELNSFRKAALELNLSPSVVSYHIDQLEEKLNTSLLYRSTRKLSLTPEGRRLLQSAQQMIRAAESGMQAINALHDTLSGTLTITIPAVTIHSPLFKKISAFIADNPKIHIDMIVTDKRMDLINEGIDLAIRIGRKELKQSSLKSQKIGEIPRLLVASPSLAKSYSHPIRPKDLSFWPWLGLKMLPLERKLIHQSKKPALIKYTPRIQVDNVAALTQMTLQGLGVSTPPDFLIDAALKQKKLIHLLPEWQVPPIELFAVWPHHTHHALLREAFVEYLQHD